MIFWNYVKQNIYIIRNNVSSVEKFGGGILLHRFFAGMFIVGMLTVCVVAGLPASSQSGNSRQSVDVPQSLDESVTDQASVTVDRNSQNYVSDEVIVKFRSHGSGNDDAAKKIRENTHASIGAKVKKNFGNVKQSDLDLVKIPGNKTVKEAVDWYSRNPEVLYAEPNYLVYADQVPNDYYFSNLWGINKIQAPQAWDLTTGSQAVVVAVVDTGVDYTHPDLSGNMWINTDEIPGNGVDDDSNGYIDDAYGWDFCNHDNAPMDDYGHGTHCAGTIGATGNNGIGVTGVAWNVKIKIMPLKFMSAGGSGTTADAAEAIRYAGASGAAVISN